MSYSLTMHSRHVATVNRTAIEHFIILISVLGERAPSSPSNKHNRNQSAVWIFRVKFNFPFILISNIDETDTPKKRFGETSPKPRQPRD